MYLALKTLPDIMSTCYQGERTIHMSFSNFNSRAELLFSNTKPSKCICGLAVLPWLSIHLKGPDCSAACYIHIVASSVGMEIILLSEIVVLSMVSCRRIDQIHCHTPVKLLFIASYETQCLRGIWSCITLIWLCSKLSFWLKLIMTEINTVIQWHQYTRYKCMH